MAKKQNTRFSSAKHIKNSAKQKIKKSDEIIVVAKTPIEQIIHETSNAKEVKNAIKRLLKDDKKETIDSKIAEAKAKKAEDSGLYNNNKKLLSGAYHQEIYSEAKALDYSKLFSYLSHSKPAVEYEQTSASQTTSQVKTADNDIVSEKEITSYLDRFMMCSLFGGGINNINPEEKERMKNYTAFNKSWILLKIQLNNYVNKDNIDLDRIV